MMHVAMKIIALMTMDAVLKLTPPSYAYSLGEYRIIKLVGWRVNSSSVAPAIFAGLLTASQDICWMRMAEKAPQACRRIVRYFLGCITVSKEAT
jgi:hypothetical protein